MEIQQMKAQAKEEKQRRQIERSKYAREKKLREAAEKEKLELERRYQQLQDEMRSASEALVSELLSINTPKSTILKRWIILASIRRNERTVSRKKSTEREASATDWMQSK